MTDVNSHDNIDTLSLINTTAQIQMARWLNWLERPVHTREVESSSLSLATIRRGIEVVITRRSWKPFVRKGAWVRIPPSAFEYKILPLYYIEATLSGSVGTGRRARLRILWLLQSCGFKSHLPHCIRRMISPELCGCSSMVEHQPSKLDTWVRFPSPAYRAIAKW